MTRASDRPSLAFRRIRWRAVAGITASMAALVLGLSCSSSEPIDRVTIVNPTPFDVEVQVTDSHKESWLILGAAAHGSITVNRLIPDMGKTWIFRFHYGGRDVGELTVTREQLVRNDWRVEVPSAVADQMRRLGFEPPPDI